MANVYTVNFIHTVCNLNLPIINYLKLVKLKLEIPSFTQNNQVSVDWFDTLRFYC